MELAKCVEIGCLNVQYAERLLKNVFYYIEKSFYSNVGCYSSLSRSLTNINLNLLLSYRQIVTEYYATAY